MKYVVRAKKVKVTDKLKEYTEEKLSKLEKYFVDSFFEKNQEFYVIPKPKSITKERKNEIKEHLRQYCEIMLKVNLSEMENARITETQDRIKNYIIDKLISGE